MIKSSLPTQLAPSREGSHIWPDVISKLKGERSYYLIIFASLILWFVGAQFLYSFIDGPDVTTQNRASGFAVKMMTYGFVYLLCAAILRIIQFNKNTEHSSIISGLQQAWSKDPSRPVIWIIHACLALVTYVLLMTNFMSVKTLIPDMIPFYLDTAAYHIDRAIFLGNDPWTLLSWVYDIPLLIVSIDRIYTAWAGLVIGIWIYCFTSRAMPQQERYQYIFSMILLWLFAGNILATLLSSAGPCYFEYFTGQDYYQPLVAQLAALHETHHLGAYEYFDVLLTMYENKESRFAGISALPSLHCAASFMMLLLFWKNKLLRVLLIAFNITIYVGSILLAWHYAIDGLLAYPVTLLCWWMGGKISTHLTQKYLST